MTYGDKERYSRQILFTGIGEQGQQRLLSSRVTIVGCGALGSVQAMELARAGVGHLTIIDRDYVEPSNLQRQLLFEESDAADGLPKAVAAERILRRINSGIGVRGLVEDLNPSNADDLLDGADLILDGTDNFETRYLINDFAVNCGVPWIYGAAVGSYGIEMPVMPGRTACLRCVYPEPPSGAQLTCENAGVLNTVTAIVASLQVADALRILSGAQDHLIPRITTVDVWAGAVRQTEQPAADPDCPACVRHEFVYLRGERRAPISLCGRNAVQIHNSTQPLDLAQLKIRLGAMGEVRANEFALRFFHTPFEMTIFADGRAIIKGTTDPGVARSLYARFIGN
ncbi:MAG: thiamine biosynthesis protein ThiF [Acidobacteria bacterium]|nr:MAG: thiamine biosynthesis protein ThiF [Acidobacteriota bacterium]